MHGRLNGKLTPVFAGYDTDAYTLPVRLLTARNAVARLQELAPAEPTHPLTARQELAEQFAAAAAKNAPLPTLHTLREAEREHADWELTCAVIADALEVAERGLHASDDIITDHLRPAVMQVQSDLLALAKVLPDDACDRVMSSPSVSHKARQSWHDLDNLSARYAAICTAYDIVAGPPGYEADSGEWAYFDNVTELWPGWSRRNSPAISGNVVAPWPLEPRERLLWLARNGARLVCLTVDERAARWQDKYGAAAEQRARVIGNAHALAGSVL